MSKIDLHMHSCYSADGQCTPEDLMQMCSNAGLSAVSITDHDSIKAVQQAAPYAKQHGITLIPGVELDCTHDGVDLHLLGYHIDPDPSVYDPVEENILEQNRQAGEERMKIVKEAGIDFDENYARSLAFHGVITGEMIGEAIMAFPENRKNPLLAPYFPGGEKSDNPFLHFYWDFCSQGKPFFIPLHYMSLKEAAALIRNTGGVPILAHPGATVKERMELMKSIFQEDVCGMEVYSSYHNKRQINFYKRWAQQTGIIATCGSDFHGKSKPTIQLGSVDCEGNELEILSALLRAKQ